MSRRRAVACFAHPWSGLVEHLEGRMLLNSDVAPKPIPVDLLTPAISAPSLDGTIIPDAYEPNDTQATAYNLRTLRNVTLNNLNIDAASNDDYYRFTAGADGTLTVDVNFANADGNLDASLLDDGGGVLASSTGTTDGEHIGFAVTRGTSYTVRVFGADGATNPSYSLALAGPAVAADAMEINDGMAAPSVLPNLGNYSHDNLTIHSSNDRDYYRFVAQESGPATVSINFANRDGDLDLAVFDSTGKIIGSSNGVTNTETSTVNVTKGKTYLVWVYGYAGQINWNYSLSIAAPVDTTLPTVTSAFYDYDTGYGVAVNFSELVSGMGPSTCAIVNQTTGLKLASPDIYDTWTSSSNWIGYKHMIPDGNYTMTIKAAGVSDLGYNALDGNADGTGGDDYQMSFFVLNGDANRDRHVDTADFLAVATNFNGTGKTYDDGDFNHDGKVNALDFNAVASQFGKSVDLPAPATVATSVAILPDDAPAAAAPSLFNSTLISADQTSGLGILD